MGTLVSLDWGQASSFISGRFPNFVINPTVPSNIGTFTVTAILKDNSALSLSQSYSFTITVNGATINTTGGKSANSTSSKIADIFGPNRPKLKPIDPNKELIPLIAKIKSIGLKGNVEISFNKNIGLITNYTYFDAKVLEISVLSGKDSNASELLITSWNVTSKKLCYYNFLYIEMTKTSLSLLI